MYILKNAYLSIIRGKGRNILIGIIITAITIGACVTITINKSGNALVDSYVNNNPLEVSFSLDPMSFREASEEERADFELLDVETISTIGKSDLVIDYYYTVQASLNSDGIDPIDYSTLFNETESTDETVVEARPRGNFSQSDFRVTAYSDISYNEDFIDGTKKIITGSMITKDNIDNVIVISEELATANSLEVGSTVTFNNTNDETITYEFTILGIYEDNSDADTSGFGMNSTNSRNEIITNLDSVNKITSDDTASSSDTTNNIMQSSITAKFYINDEDIDAFTTFVRDSGVSEYYGVVTNADALTSTLKPIQSISDFSFTFLIIILLIGSTILVIINLINIRERKYEIGVLRAIGMTKSKVTMQLVSEIFIVAFISLIIGTGIGTSISQPVSNYMLKNEIASSQAKTENIEHNFGSGQFSRPGFNGGREAANVDYVSTLDVSTDSETMLQLFIMSLFLTILSGCVAVMFVNKYEPNKILQNRG